MPKITVKNSKPNMQTPNTQIGNWLKSTPAAPWQQLVTQPSQNALNLMVTCDQATTSALTAVATEAVKYADNNWSTSNTTCITDLAELFPNPMDPSCLEFLQAENA
jgi:L-lactate utilization protein LutC